MLVSREQTQTAREHASVSRPDKVMNHRPSRMPDPLTAAVRAGLEQRLSRIILEGGLTIRLPSGETVSLGDVSAPGAIRLRLRDARTAWRLALNPDLGLGEAYMDGGLTIEHGTLAELFDLIGRNLERRPERPPGLFSSLARQIGQANDRRAARRNVAHHYDLSLELYRRFLDDDLQYSCAYFEHPGMTLEAAQAAKKRHLAAKLLLEPGQEVLDIGCGWGGLALTLAEEAGVRVTGITLSPEQLAVAEARAAERRLGDRVHFRLQDYRDVAPSFDRIVSVGMFEHVGTPNYQAFFDTIARLLTDDGVAVVHSIGRNRPAGRSQPWIAKYIFPGGYIPALSEVLPAIERAGLWVTDVEILRLHYAETLKAWGDRFAARRSEIAQLYDERFCRMWEFYLAACETAFRRRGCMVFQLQLSKRVDGVPLTRGYMNEPHAAA